MMYTLINSINLGTKASIFVFTVCINSLSWDDAAQNINKKAVMYFIPIYVAYCVIYVKYLLVSKTVHSVVFWGRAFILRCSDLL